MKLDYVLGLKIEDFLERRLQTQVRFISERQDSKERVTIIQLFFSSGRKLSIEVIPNTAEEWLVIG